MLSRREAVVSCDVREFPPSQRPSDVKDQGIHPQKTAGRLVKACLSADRAPHSRTCAIVGPARPVDLRICSPSCPGHPDSRCAHGRALMLRLVRERDWGTGGWGTRVRGVGVGWAGEVGVGGANGSATAASERPARAGQVRRDGPVPWVGGEHERSGAILASGQRRRPFGRPPCQPGGSRHDSDISGRARRRRAPTPLAGVPPSWRTKFWSKNSSRC